MMSNIPSAERISRSGWRASGTPAGVASNGWMTRPRAARAIASGSAATASTSGWWRGPMPVSGPG
jgi:hypothetical protein